MIAFDRLHGAHLIFFDFDGVIKDSVDVKTQAFVKLFEPYGARVIDRVRLHHESNGGMSRFDKLPIYLRWAGEDTTAEQVDEFCNRFSQLAEQGVIDAPWVAGAEEYLRRNAKRKTFVLVSATPWEELERLLYALNLRDCFASVFGAPTSKREAIDQTLKDRGIDPRDCLMIGDAREDLEAARANDVPFLLRRHATNGEVFSDYIGLSIDDFAEL